MNITVVIVIVAILMTMATVDGQTDGRTEARTGSGAAAESGCSGQPKGPAARATAAGGRPMRSFFGKLRLGARDSGKPIRRTARQPGRQAARQPARPPARPPGSQAASQTTRQPARPLGSQAASQAARQPDSQTARFLIISSLTAAPPLAMCARRRPTFGGPSLMWPTTSLAQSG